MKVSLIMCVQAITVFNYLQKGLLSRHDQQDIVVTIDLQIYLGFILCKSRLPRGIHYENNLKYNFDVLVLNKNKVSCKVGNKFLLVPASSSL